VVDDSAITFTNRTPAPIDVTVTAAP